MKATILAGAALALSLLTPAFAATTFDVGALLVEKKGAQGPAVILIPGLSSGPWTWDDTVARLAPNYAIYLVTLPGFNGRAPQPGANFDSLQKDLLQLIESQKLRKPVLIGHSLGSTLSIAFATQHAAAIAGVVAVDGLPVFPGTEKSNDRQQLAERVRSQMANQTREQFAAGQVLYMKQAVLDPGIATKLAELSSRSDAGATADFAAQIMALDLRPRLGNISVPIVAISPFHVPDFARMNMDENAKTEYYRSLFDGVKQLEVVSISPARHFVMFDQPEKFAAAVDRALAKMFGSSK